MINKNGLRFVFLFKKLKNQNTDKTGFSEEINLKNNIFQKENTEYSV